MTRAHRHAWVRGIGGASLPGAAVLGILLGGVPAARATPDGCQRAVVRQAARLVQTRMKAMRQCEQRVLHGTAAGPCPDARTAKRLAAAEARLAVRLARACGGRDRECDATDTGAAADDSPATIGWPEACPNLGQATCSNAIADCDDVGTCLACTARVAVDEAVGLFYGGAPAAPGTALHDCQEAIGKGAAQLFEASARALALCEDRVLKGRASGPCPDQRSADVMAQARARTAGRICAACGGGDGACGGGDDLAVAAIGFAASCPDVVVPGGAACAGPVTDLPGLIDCVACVASYETACLDAMQVPALVSYPPECVSAIPCPGRIEFASIPGRFGSTDLGWTGLLHGTPTVASDATFSVAVTGCEHATRPCGSCDFAGPIPNLGADAGVIHNRRCAGDTRTKCADDADCAAVGGPCAFYLGTPLSFIAIGAPACSVQQLAAFDGTVDFESGATTAHLVGDVDLYFSELCPRCDGDGAANDGLREGTCVGGENAGLSCDRNGASTHPSFGASSLDCPPLAVLRSASRSLTRDSTLATTTQTWTLTAESPACRANGYGLFKCFCSTCDDAAGTVCRSDADCVAVGATTCGGPRCLGGAAPGMPCTTHADCGAGSACGVPGQPTQPNQCNDQTCVPSGATDGSCVSGPYDGRCLPNATFHGCSFDFECAAYTSCSGGASDGAPCLGAADCPGGACVPETCGALSRSCYPDNGLIGGSVSVAGAAGTPVAGEWGVTFAELFCEEPSGEFAINGLIGRPGVGRYQLELRARARP